MAKNIAVDDQIIATEDIDLLDGQVIKRGHGGVVVDLTGQDHWDLLVEWDCETTSAANSDSVSLVECRESGEPHALYTDGSVCRCEHPEMFRVQPVDGEIIQ